MSVARWIASALLVVALAVGTGSDAAPAPSSIMLGGYRLLAVDFHVHPFPLSWSTLAPWDLVLEARRQGLDAVAIAGHNHVWVGQVARWFSKLVGGPTVIRSEEIHPPNGHIIALGIERTVDWRLGTEGAIDEIHRRGGAAIAAHPVASSWRMWSDSAMSKLDGVEVVQPVTWLNEDAAREMREFYKRAGAAAIGDSDYHGFGPVGVCRTWVFARDDSEAAILEAVRAKRTVVWDVSSYLGEPEFVRLAEGIEKLGARGDPGTLVKLSRAFAVLGLLLALFGGSKRPPGEVRQVK